MSAKGYCQYLTRHIDRCSWTDLAERRLEGVDVGSLRGESGLALAVGAKERGTRLVVADDGSSTCDRHRNDEE